jgi:peptide-methionine (R)-S-oxide reductase
MAKDEKEKVDIKALTESDWKERLSPDEFRVLRQAGTERPHSGKFNMHFEDGKYRCNACGNPLFDSETKFDAGCGWPSFDRAIPGSIEERKDSSHGMVRTEVLCANCQSHLGHVFPDGPTETGNRYCINSVSIDFEEK